MAVILLGTSSDGHNVLATPPRPQLRSSSVQQAEPLLAAVWSLVELGVEKEQPGWRRIGELGSLRGDWTDTVAGRRRRCRSASRWRASLCSLYESWNLYFGFLSLSRSLQFRSIWLQIRGIPSWTLQDSIMIETMVLYQDMEC